MTEFFENGSTIADYTYTLVNPGTEALALFSHNIIVLIEITVIKIDIMYTYSMFIQHLLHFKIIQLIKLEPGYCTRTLSSVKVVFLVLN